MATGLFADLTTQYDQDETLQKDVLLEQGHGRRCDGRQAVHPAPALPRTPFSWRWRTSCKRRGWKYPNCPKTVRGIFEHGIVPRGEALGTSAGPMWFAANLAQCFSRPSAITAPGRFPWTRKHLPRPFSRVYGAALLAWTGRALRRMVGFGPISYPLTARWSTLFLSDDLFLYLDIAYAQNQDLVGGAFRRPGRLYRGQCHLLWGGVRQLRRRRGSL